MSDQTVDREVLACVADDYMGLWEVARVVGRRMARAAFPEIKAEAMKVLTRLYSAGYIEAGNLTEEGAFLPWALAPSQALNKIQGEWDRLGRLPDIGEIAWLNLTPSGEERLQNQN
jgi:hypothetical protein